MKNDDLFAASAAATAVGVGTQVPALSGIATYLIAGGAHTVAGAAVTVGAGIAGGIVSVIGAPLLIIGGIAGLLYFGQDE